MSVVGGPDGRAASDPTLGSLRSPLRWLALGLLASCGGGDGPAHSERDRLDVLIVTFDTTRADHLGAYGGPAEISPHFDALAEESVLFERAMAPTPITMPSHATVMTGLAPLFHGVRDNGRFRLDDKFSTLAERAADAGYETAGFVSAEVLHGRYGLEQGFEHYSTPPIGEAEGGLRPYERRAGDTVAEFESWAIDAVAGDEPWFVWVHFFDPHQPFAAPKEFADRFPDPYEAEIAYADSQLGRLWERWCELRSADSTLLVVTADHGESRGDHGESTHGMFVYDPTQRVPMLVRAPDSSARRVGGQVGLVDVAPTVLDYLGLEPEGEICGRSLADVLRGGPAPQHDVYLETQLCWYSYEAAPFEAISTPTLKLVVSQSELAEPELYDLTADPGEIQNLAAERPGEVADLLARLERLRRGHSSLPPVEVRNMTAAEQARLQELGYVFSDGNESFDLDPRKARPVHEVLQWIDVLLVAIAAYELGHDDRAEPMLRDVLKEWPEQSIAHSLLGQILKKRGEDEAAIESLETALALRPSQPIAVLDLARVYQKNKKPNKALKTLRKYLELDSTHVEILFLAAEICGRKGEYVAAREYLEKAAEQPLTDAQRAEIERRLGIVDALESGRAPDGGGVDGG